jgi:nicotinate dehydrogenase subunit A
LLQKNPSASDAEIRTTLEPNLCRCGTHMRILRAVRRAAGLMHAASNQTTEGVR